MKPAGEFKEGERVAWGLRVVTISKITRTGVIKIDGHEDVSFRADGYGRGSWDAWDNTPRWIKKLTPALEAEITQVNEAREARAELEDLIRRKLTTIASRWVKPSSPTFRPADDLRRIIDAIKAALPDDMQEPKT